MAEPLNPLLSPRRLRSLAESVVDYINEQIAAGALVPGDKLPTESTLKSVLGVSRTVIREATSRLQASGVIETRHGIGSFVLKPPCENIDIAIAPATALGDVLTMLELRISLESESARLAAQRATPGDVARIRTALLAIEEASHAGGDSVAADLQFHLSVAQATSNRYFVDILTGMGTALIPRFRVNSATVARAEPKDYVALVNIEHQSIVEAIARRDAESAGAAMRMHLSKSRERLRGGSKPETAV